MFTNVQYGSTTETCAMDVCSVQENCAWVIDGSDALFPMRVSDAVSDGEWLVRELNLYLKKNLMTSHLTIADVVRRGLMAIHREFQRFPNADQLYDLDMPSACCAIVRVRNDKLSYFIIGNCELILTYADGNTITLSDLRLQELDAKLLEISQDLRRKQRMPLFRARNFMDNLLVENRLRRNIEGGYYVLGEDSDVVKHALTGTIPLKDIKSISLVCNGFSQYFNCRKVIHNLDTYLKQKRTPDFVEIYDRLLNKKMRNQKLAKYMQEKLSGQSTVVFFDVEETAKLVSR